MNIAFCFLITLSDALQSDAGLNDIITPDVMSKTLQSLDKSCGSNCVRTFRELAPEINKIATESAAGSLDASITQKMSGDIQKLIGKLTHEVTYHSNLVSPAFFF